MGFPAPSDPGTGILVDHGNTGATETFDVSAGDHHTATLDANCTFSFTGATDGIPAQMRLAIKQDATGSRLVTWPLEAHFPGGVAPTLTTIATRTDLIDVTSYDGGVNWYCVVVAQNILTTGGTPEDPSAIAGLALWLKADAITGLLDAASVTQWNDSSSNGRNVAQATGAAQPTYRTAQINGLPSVRFDGGDWLATAGNVTVKPNTVFAVMKFTDVSTARTILGPSAVGGFVWRLDTPSRKPQLLKSNTAGIATATTALAAGTWVIAAASYSGVGAWAFYDQSVTADGIGTNDQTITATALRVGVDIASDFFLGDIAELIVYDNVLSDADRLSVLSYLEGKYALPLA